jgi:hypothetical protein
MNVIPVTIYAAELAVAAIVLFYLVKLLTMPTNVKRVCQGRVSDWSTGWLCPPPPTSHVGPLAPNSQSNPSIIR